MTRSDTLRRVTVTEAIRGARAWIGPDLRPVEDATLLIQDTTIVACGPSQGVAVPEGIAVTDAGDVTLLPGFIDAHVHIGLADPAEVVRGGITCVRDLAWPLPAIDRLREASRRPDHVGPHVIAAGTMLTAPGGYPMKAGWAPPRTGREVASPAGAEQAVAELAEWGACVIKTALNPAAGPDLTPPVLGAIVNAAHRVGLKVTCHLYGIDRLELALDAGVDELAHMVMSEESIPDGLIARMVETGMTIVPTLSIRSGGDLHLAIGNLERFNAAGGRVVYGTDLGNEGPRPGIDRREVAAMWQAGMDGRAIATSATAGAAAYLGLATKGTLAVGMDADIIAVEGDPTADPMRLAEVAFVWREGRRVR